jgi:hypothetical protein
VHAIAVVVFPYIESPRPCSRVSGSPRADGQLVLAIQIVLHHVDSEVSRGGLLERERREQNRTEKKS